MTDQERAIISDKKNVVVTASAGSGKTFTMVSRVIRLIAEEGVPLSSIVMLTFTEAAAQEMKTRLGDALLREIKSASPEKRGRLIGALDEMPLLNCGTIDSFCYKLVKTHFELLGISPMHAVADEELMKSYRKRAMDEVMSRFHKEDEEGYLRLSYRFQTDEVLRRSVEELYQYARKTEQEEAFLSRAQEIASSPVESSPAVLEYLKSMRFYAQETRSRILPLYEGLGRESVGMHKRTAYFLNALEDYANCRTLRELIDCVRSAERMPSVNKDERARYIKDAALSEAADDLFLRFRKEITFEKEQLKSSFFTDYEKTLSAAESACQDILRLIELVRSFREEYALLKDRDRLLDYDDLEHYALRLVRDHGVGKELDCRYLLVDECQDLNPLQDTLIRLLVEQGNLFAVGDVKQSIYRFRLSDPDLFHDRIDRGKEDRLGSEVISFCRNFRSSDEVISFVNLVFSKMMTKSFGGVDYKGEELVGQRKGTGGVRCFFSEEKQEEPRPITEVYSLKKEVSSLRERASFGEEAEWIRDRILETVGKTYRDTKEDREQVIAYRDIAVLSSVRMRPGSREEAIVRCLRQAGIPLNLGDFEDKDKLSEIDVLVDLLRLIESPHDDYALLSVLRSDLFDVDLEELARISLKEGKSFSEKAEKAAAMEESPKLAAFYDYLARLRFLSSAMTLYDLISLVIEERYRLPILRRQDGRQVFGELLRFADSLKGMPQASSVAEFIAFYDEYYEAAASGEVEDENAVSMMTIHKSKGMEFPVVFVICADRVKGSSSDLYVDKEYGAIKKTAFEAEKVMKENLLSALFKRKKKRENREDKLRLLYVALTRAKNYLFVSGTLKTADYEKLDRPEDADSPVVWMAAAMRGKMEYEKEYVRKGEAPRAVISTREESEIGDLDALKQAFSYRYSHEKATETGIKFTVTAINAMDDEGYYPPTLLFPEERKAKGTAFHAVLENMPFTLKDKKETADYLDKSVEDGVITAEERKEISAKTVFEALSVIRELVGGRKVYREKSFMLRLPARDAKVADIDDEVEVQGKIDLLAIGEKDAIIVDYKLSALSEEELREKYRDQLALYAIAVGRSLGIEKIDAYIFVPGRKVLIRL